MPWVFFTRALRVMFCSSVTYPPRLTVRLVPLFVPRRTISPVFVRFVPVTGPRRTLPGAEGPNASPFGELAEVPSGSEHCRRELPVRSPAGRVPYVQQKTAALCSTRRPPSKTLTSRSSLHIHVEFTHIGSPAAGLHDGNLFSVKIRHPVGLLEESV